MLLRPGFDDRCGSRRTLRAHRVRSLRCRGVAGSRFSPRFAPAPAALGSDCRPAALRARL
eukprot:9540860-Alexandrium_andersonii.AAC.1